MIYILIDSIAISITGTIGMLFSKKIQQRQIDALYNILGIIILILGFQGIIQADKFLIIAVSMFIGSFIGSAIEIEDKINKKARTFSKEGSDMVTGIIAIIMYVCMGSLAILGPLNLAITKDPTLMNFKTFLDCTTCVVFGALYGKSIYPAAVIMFIYQMLIFLLGHLIQPILTQAVVSQLGQIGSVILIALAFNLLGLKDIKILDLTPSLLVPIVFSLIFNALGIPA